MQVRVNDQPDQPVGMDHKALGDLAREVCHTDDERPRMVVDLRCDGQAVTEADLDRFLASPLDAFEQVEILIQSVAAMVKAALTQAIQLFEEAGNTRRRVADLLDEGRYEPAMQDLGNYFAVWQQVQNSMQLSASSLGTDLGVLQAEGRQVVELFEDIRSCLAALKEAMANRDFVLVSDMLRYELEGPSGAWQNLLRQLLDIADGK